MNFELDEEHRMLKDLVARFLREDLVPLEWAMMAREASEGRLSLTAEEQQPLERKAQALGLWGLDAPKDLGGSNLPVVAMIGVYEAMGGTVTPFTLAPDSPNLRMLQLAATPAQRERYLGLHHRQGNARLQCAAPHPDDRRPRDPRDRVGGLPHPGVSTARRRRAGLCTHAGPAVRRGGCRWPRAASVWRSARSTCFASTPRSAKPSAHRWPSARRSDGGWPMRPPKSTPAG